MDGILLADGTFVTKNVTYHIDLLKKIFPGCNSESEAIKRYNCMFLVENKDIHTGIHCLQEDFVVFEKKDITRAQILFLKNHINELSLSQIRRILELAQIKGLVYYEKCDNCINYCVRADFINGKHKFVRETDKNEYLKGNLKPDDYCECCRSCRKEN